MIRWVLVFLCCLTFPAWATQDAWPALYDVTDVASDDVLNIRAAPDGTAEIVGTLPFDAKSVEIIRPNDRESWGLVNTREASGWVSLRYLKRQPGQWLGSIPALTRCFGTEPFWNLSFARTDTAPIANWSTPEETIAFALDNSAPSLNRRDRYSLIGKTEDNSGRQITGVIRLERCSDGMSDRSYGIGLDLILQLGLRGAPVYSGCCSIAP